jgi:hypothetical protein
MGVVGVLLPYLLESKMSLYAVSQLTSVESVHCTIPTRKYNDLPVPDTRVATRVGRRYKSLDSAIRLARKVGGWVTDLNGGRIVFDANDMTGA